MKITGSFPIDTKKYDRKYNVVTVTLERVRPGWLRTLSLCALGLLVLLHLTHFHNQNTLTFCVITLHFETSLIAKQFDFYCVLHIFLIFAPSCVLSVFQFTL